MAIFWVLAPCSLAIALMMEAASTSETLVNFYQTSRCNSPEDSHLHTHRRENLKSYLLAQLIANPKAVLPLRRRDCDSINKDHFTVAYWSNLQFVMALLPPARPRCDDDSP
jgi:hypothetical protein